MRGQEQSFVLIERIAVGHAGHVIGDGAGTACRSRLGFHALRTLPVFVWHQPGKLITESIQVKLICRRTITQTQARSSGKIAETTILFETDLYPETPTYSDLLQETCAVTIPKDAELSTDLSTSRSITWGIDVIARIPNAPDITETFLFTVDDPELRARQEAAWEAEDAEEK